MVEIQKIENFVMEKFVTLCFGYLNCKLQTHVAWAFAVGEERT